MTSQSRIKTEKSKHMNTERLGSSIEIGNTPFKKTRIAKYLISYILNDLKQQSFGQKLPHYLIDYFDIKLDMDISNIKIHNDSKSSTYANMLDAEAFTIGNDIFFDNSKFDLQSENGLDLLYHEIAHTFQNSDEFIEKNIHDGSWNFSDIHDLYEIEADKISNKILNGYNMTDHETIFPLRQINGLIQRQFNGMQNEFEIGSNNVVKLLVNSLTRSISEDPIGSTDRIRFILKGLDQNVLAQVLNELKDSLDISQWEGFKSHFGSEFEVTEVEISDHEKQSKISVTEGFSETNQSTVQLTSKELPTTMSTQNLVSSTSLDIPEAKTEIQLENTEQLSQTSPEILEAVTEKQLDQTEAVLSNSNEVTEETSPSSTEQKSATPESDPEFQAVVMATKTVAAKQKSLPLVESEVSTIHAAAKGPENELASQAKDVQIKKMSQQKPEVFDREAFKKSLLDKVEQITPKNQEEADDFKEKGKTSTITQWSDTLISNEKDKSQAPIQNTANEPLDLGKGQQKVVVPIPEPEPVKIGTNVGAEKAVPKPKPDLEISMEMESSKLDELTPEFTDEAMIKTGEAIFMDAAAVKAEAKASAQQVPILYRQEENSILSEANNKAIEESFTNLNNLNNKRSSSLLQSHGDKKDTQTKDEKQRQKISDDIEKIYNDTQLSVKETLDQLSFKVNKTFDEDVKAAANNFETWVDRRMKEYKDDRYSGAGALRWPFDKLLGLPDEVNKFYVQGREQYIRDMNKAIDKIADIVATDLTKVQNDIAIGKNKVQTYVDSLPVELKKFGDEAATKIKTKFESLKNSVDEKSNELIDNLASKYVENVKKIDESIEKKKEENRGLISKAKDALVGAYEAFVALKNMLVNIVTKGIEIIGKILDDPIGFVGNLISGVEAGFESFVSNIGAHLKKGLIEWLFGELGEAGIQMPESFDSKGVFSLLIQILGISYFNIRNKIAKRVGEEKVSKFEKMIQAGEKILDVAQEGFVIFQILINEGFVGLWQYIKDKLDTLKDMVFDQIQSWLENSIIRAGVKWILSLFNPIAAFIKAVLAIVDIIKFFVERASQIGRLINSILDAFSEIADGNTKAVATKVEDALASGIPVVIGLLASLLGLSGLSDTVKGIMKKVQGTVDVAVDWIIGKVVGVVEWLGQKFGLGEKNKEIEEHVPLKGEQEIFDKTEKESKINEGIRELHKLEESYIEEGKISKKEAEVVATIIKEHHPVFKYIKVISGDSTHTWDYLYSASDPVTIKGSTKEGIGWKSFITQKQEERLSLIKTRIANETPRPDWEDRLDKYLDQAKDSVALSNLINDLAYRLEKVISLHREALKRKEEKEEVEKETSETMRTFDELNDARIIVGWTIEEFSVSSNPNKGPQPARFARGNFVHTFAPVILPHRFAGRTYRTEVVTRDRFRADVVFTDGPADTPYSVADIKPQNSDYNRALSQVQTYVKELNEKYGGGYRVDPIPIISYTAEQAIRWIIMDFVQRFPDLPLSLLEERAREVGRLYGF